MLPPGREGPAIRAIGRARGGTGLGKKPSTHFIFFPGGWGRPTKFTIATFTQILVLFAGWGRLGVGRAKL